MWILTLCSSPAHAHCVVITTMGKAGLSSGPGIYHRARHEVDTGQRFMQFLNLFSVQMRKKGPERWYNPAKVTQQILISEHFIWAQNPLPSSIGSDLIYFVLFCLSEKTINNWGRLFFPQGKSRKVTVYSMKNISMSQSWAKHFHVNSQEFSRNSEFWPSPSHGELRATKSAAHRASTDANLRALLAQRYPCRLC